MKYNQNSFFATRTQRLSLQIPFLQQGPKFPWHSPVAQKSSKAVNRRNLGSSQFYDRNVADSPGKSLLRKLAAGKSRETARNNIFFSDEL